MGSCFSSWVKADNPFHIGSRPGFFRREGNHSSNSSSQVSSVSGTSIARTEGEILQSGNLKKFSFNELKIATRNFRPDSLLGAGGFGCVYKGWIDEHTFAPAKPGTGLVIAVKRLNKEGLQGHKEWLAEINYLGHLSHPYLVKLIGYCLEDDHRLLVYEFMPKGSLENHLFRRSSHFQPISWNIRMKIALGAAKGLEFLHSDEAKVIYRDFKTSNILLDSNYDAKLSDFGLAKDGPLGDRSHVSTRVMGTYGYAAPDYMKTGHLTAKSDVYSFGVVLLEIISGRRVLDKNRPSGEHNLIEWAKPYLASKRRVFQVMDNRIEGQYTINGAQKVAQLVLRCLANEPKQRPDMKVVVRVLEHLQDLGGVGASHREEPRTGGSHASPGPRHITENVNKPRGGEVTAHGVITFSTSQIDGGKGK